MEINRSTRLEKHLTFGILLMVYNFHTFLKALHFSKFFQIFEIHQKLMLKLLNAIFFYLTTVGQTQWNIICPFLTIKILRLILRQALNGDKLSVYRDIK